MNGVTDFATGVKAASDVEKNKSKNIDRSNFHWHSWGPGFFSSKDPAPPGVDTETYNRVYLEWVDSMRKAHRK